MGRIIDYETIKSRAFYHIDFKIRDSEFSFSGEKGLGDPKEVLEIVKDLQSKNITPEIGRTIVYNRTKSGYRTRDPETETLSMERLEEIATTQESLPEFENPVVSSSYRTNSI